MNENDKKLSRKHSLKLFCLTECLGAQAIFLSASYKNRGNHKGSIGLHHHRSPIQVFFRRGPPGSGYQIPPLAYKAPKRTLPPSFLEAHSITPKRICCSGESFIFANYFLTGAHCYKYDRSKRQKLIEKTVKSCWIFSPPQKATQYFFVWSPSLLSFPLRFHM